MGRDLEKGPGPGEEDLALSCFPHGCLGAEVIYNELMSDFEMDEKDFAADSWSLAVDSSFLQQHKKEVMKQQDVIYGEPRRLPLDSCFFTRSCVLCPSASPHCSRRFPSYPPDLQDPAWRPTICYWVPHLLGLLVSKALSLSLSSSQFLVFTLCLCHAQHWAGDSGKPGHVEDMWFLP